jgi:hypothetical protein
MEPEFIFYKKCIFRLYYAQELYGISPGIKRQVKNIISTRIIFTDFITGRGKECQEYFTSREYLPEFFHHRPSLFKLTKRRTMEPNDFRTGNNLFTYIFKDIFSSPDP